LDQFRFATFASTRRPTNVMQGMQTQHYLIKAAIIHQCAHL